MAGSQRDLAEEVRAGRFRDDLYYRLNVVSLALPPLRARKGDIPALVNHFLVDVRPRPQAKKIAGVTPGTLSALFAYDWPGNVRELASVVERAVAVAQGREIAAEDLSPVLHGAPPGGERRLGAHPRRDALRESSARRSCARSSSAADRPPARPRCSASRSGRSSTG